MGGGETLDKLKGKVVLAAHEYLFPGNKNIFKDDQRLPADDAVFRIALVHQAAAAFTVVVGLATEDMDQSGGINRHITTHGVVGIRLFQRGGRHYQMAEGIDGAGDMRFGTTYHDAVLFLFNDTDILVGVSLLAG